ncbi:MAG: ribose-phosphate diphosphokinase, partial [Hyphomicrobiaceae bacterium]
MTADDVCLFALDASRPYGERVATALGLALGRHEEREFEDGEHKARPLENVRGRDVYVLHSLYGEPGMSANDKLVRLLFFIAALKDASAARVTAVCPYLAYSRKDRRSKPRDPVGSRYVAQLFEAVGTDRMVTLDVHNLAAYQNAFRIPAEHLEARSLFVAWFAARLGDEAVVVVSPDAGGVKRADALRDSLARALGGPVGSAFMEKRRSEGVVSGEAVVGEVSGMTALIIDDLISSGTTLARAATACKALGAKRVFAAATHGMFAGAAGTVLDDPALEKVLVTD